MGYSGVPLMCVSHLNKRFGEGCFHCRNHSVELQGNYCLGCGTVYACQDISFGTYDGEIFGMVGESDSGKSVMMQYPYFDQEVIRGNCIICTYENGAANISELTVQQQRYTHNRIPDMVCQNPYPGLKTNFPNMGDIAEKLIATGKYNIRTMSECGEELLDAVKIPVHRMKEEPRKFSSGMQQRARIIKALSNNPPTLLLDEVTTRSDLSVQADVLDLIEKIQRELGVSMPVVSHDLGAIRTLADRTIVVLDREIIERGLTDQIVEDLQHPYTQQLVYSLL